MRRSRKSIIWGAAWLVVAVSWAVIGEPWVAFVVAVLGVAYWVYAVSQLNKERNQA